MLEIILSVAAGALAIPALLVALWVFVKIIEIRDRTHASYRFAGSVKTVEGDAAPDLREYDVRIVKIHRGYRINFYDDEVLIYTVTLDKVVDQP